MNNNLAQRVGALTEAQRRSLKKRIRQQAPKDVPAIIEKINRRHASVDLSPQQRRLWTLTRFSPESTEYNIPGVFRLRGRVNEVFLKQALEMIMQRHEILRTVFVDGDGFNVQQKCIADMVLPYFTQVLPIDVSNSVLDKAIAKSVNEPLDLSKGPLWRAELIHTSEDESTLVLSMHHIIFDGWSLGVFVRELFQYYDNCRQQRVLREKPLDIQYSDYSDWQNKQVARTKNKCITFWKETLSDVSGVLQLPSDNPRQSDRSRHGALYNLTLNMSLFEKVKRVAQGLGATPFNFFHAALNVLLYRYTGQSEIVVGTPVSGREAGQTHPLIGIFVNTLPVKVNVIGQQSIADLIAQGRESALQALSHGELPFDAIVEAVNPKRVSGCNPLFQVLYTYQNKIPAIELEDFSVEYYTVDTGTSKFDLSLDVFESFDGISCLFEYDTSLFSARRIANMAAHFENIVQAMVENPGQPIATLDYLTATERALALQSAHQPKTLPNPMTFSALFDKHVAERGLYPCVVHDDRCLSYADVDNVAKLLVPSLYDCNVGPDTVVALCMPRTEMLLPAIVAVQRLGAAVVMLEPSHPVERLKFIVNDAEASLVIVDDADKEMLDGLSTNLVSLEDLIDCGGKRKVSGANASEMKLAGPQLDDPAYIVYTSGTTGQPKGVSISHSNWFNAYYGWQETYGLGDTVHNHLQMASLGFDVFLGDLIRAVGSGGKLVICPHALFGDPEQLYALICEEKIDCAEFVPAVFRELSHWLRDNNCRLDTLSVVIVASDRWYLSEYKAFLKVCGEHTRLINSYGMAEASIDSTWYELDSASTDHMDSQQLVPIGKAFPNVEVLVLDAALQLVPPGIPGEICVAGYGVANAYLKRPELSAEKFVPHPFHAGATLYRSGDIGTLRADGVIELLGRRDNQVKIRGQRIELAEIEAGLLEHPDVDQAVASVLEVSQEHKQIIAYLVMKNSKAQLDDTSLRDYLQAWVPAYMLPSQYMRLESMPLSASGKVDRKALPKPAQSHRAMESTFVSPCTLTQEMLAGIWCQIMQLPRVGIYDSFFELGGHSLTAFKVISRVKEVFNVQLPIHALVECPTIADVEKKIIALQGASTEVSNAEEKMPIAVPDPAHRHEPFELTEVQQAYWIGRNDLFEFGNVTTHSYDELETVDLDVVRFERAWNRVITRHDMLRAVIRPDGTQQVLKNLPDYQVPVNDLRQSTADELNAAINDMRNEMSHQKLDVHQWPVFDLRVTLLPDNKARLHFSTDALMWDAWSFVILIEDLVRFYINEDEPLRPLALSFRDYVNAEQQLIDGQRYQKSVRYWRQRIENLPAAPQLTMSKDPGDIKQPKFTRLHAKLAPEAWDRLKLKATKLGMTSTGITLAAYAEILMMYSQDPRFSLNLTFLNRHPLHPQVNDIVGEFTSLTLLSVDNAESNTFTARAKKIQSDLWHDIEHHYISGVQVLRDLTRANGGATRAKMPVVFTSALVVPIPKRNPKFPVTPVYRDGVTQTSQVWLDCGVWEDDRWLLCNWDVVLELYPDGMAVEMFEAYWKLIQRLADEDDIWHQDIVDVLPTKRHYQLPVAVPQPLPSAAGDTLISLFVDQVAKTPNNTAVITSRNEMSYRALSDKVAWLQSAILSVGVEPGALIAVYMDKGWEQVVATLGIMSSGVAYLPVDPGLPASRVNYLLSHCGATQIVTQPHLVKSVSEYRVPHVHVITNDSRTVGQDILRKFLPAASDLAYVIFTSGSTGQPKGVMIDHRGAVNTIQDVNERFRVTGDDRVLAVSALSFDLSVYDLFGLLSVGAAVVFPDNERRLDPTHWVELIKAHVVSLWNTVPALANLMVDCIDNDGKAISSLRTIMMSGDWIPLTLPPRLQRYCPNAQVISLGGATEASIWSVLYPIDHVESSWSSIPYGKAMAHQSMYVLDHRLAPCPDWVTGEIYIGGIGVAMGYWGDEDRTRHAFVQHPQTNERLYKTGDLGRRLPDGNLDILGRTDFQVKIQGFRIELGEIESVLSVCDDVKYAVVDAVGEQKGEKHLVGYIVPEKDNAIDLDTIQQFLRSRLPEYMVPHLMILDALPLSANGKVDRTALPVFNEPGIVEAAILPSTPWEIKVHQLWSKLLGHSDFGVNDDFFKAGGDSMIAIRLLTHASTELGAQLTLKQVFQERTVSQQAKIIADAKIL